MQTKSFVITCLNCKKMSRIRIINDTEVMYIDHTPIIACRLRPDMKWGFECMCGNDTRLAPQEKEDAHLLMSGSSQSVIDKVVKAATLTPERKFKMELA